LKLSIEQRKTSTITPYFSVALYCYCPVISDKHFPSFHALHDVRTKLTHVENNHTCMAKRQYITPKFKYLSLSAKRFIGTVVLRTILIIIDNWKIILYGNTQYNKLPDNWWQFVMIIWWTRKITLIESIFSDLHDNYINHSRLRERAVLAGKISILMLFISKYNSNNCKWDVIEIDRYCGRSRRSSKLSC
jgi:hypothetical protein